MNEQKALIEINNLSKKFCRRLKPSLVYAVQDILTESFGMRRRVDVLRRHEFWAFEDVNLKIKRGECVGVLGPNGAGKSTLLKMLNGALRPDRGEISISGRMASLIELGMGFDPVLSGLENIYVYGTILGLTESEINAKLDDIIAFSELGDFIHMPIQNYSSGMKVRLGFSVAAQVDPDILILDEVLAVGDVGFRAKCLDVIGSKMKKAAVILVTHNMNQVSRLCTSVLLLNKGKATLYDDAEEGIKAYQTTVMGTGKVIENKFTNKKISVEQFNISGSEFSTSELFSVKIDLKSAAFTGNAYFYLHIVNSAGAPLAAVFEEKVPLTFKEGQSQAISLTDIQLPLAKGRYALQFVIYTEDGRELLVWYKNVCPFEIVGEKYYQVPFLLKSNMDIQGR